MGVLPPTDMASLEVSMLLVTLSLLQLLLPMLLPLLPLLPMLPLLLLLMLPLLLLLMLPLLLPLMLMLPQLLLPPPLLSSMLATMSTTRSTMFPRSLSRSMFPPTPPAMSSTTPQLSELPSPTTVLLPPPLLPVLLLFKYLQESRTQAGKPDFHLESDLTNII